MPMPLPEVGTNGEGPGGRTGGTTRLYLRAALPIALHGGRMKRLNHLPPPELGPNVEHFLQELAGKYGEDGRHHLPAEPPVEKYKKWVEWRGQMVDTPSWWWGVGEDSRGRRHPRASPRDAGLF